MIRAGEDGAYSLMICGWRRRPRYWISRWTRSRISCVEIFRFDRNFVATFRPVSLCLATALRASAAAPPRSGAERPSVRTFDLSEAAMAERLDDLILSNVLRLVPPDRAGDPPLSLTVRRPRGAGPGRAVGRRHRRLECCRVVEIGGKRRGGRRRGQKKGEVGLGGTAAAAAQVASRGSKVLGRSDDRAPERVKAGSGRGRTGGSEGREEVRPLFEGGRRCGG